MFCCSSINLQCGCAQNCVEVRFDISKRVEIFRGKGGNSCCRKRTFNCCCDPRQRSFNCSEPDLRSQNRRHPVGTFVHLPGPGFKMLLEFFTITDVSHTVTHRRHTLGETSHPVGFESRTGTTSSDCRSPGTPKHSANYPEHLDTYRHIYHSFYNFA